MSKKNSKFSAKFVLLTNILLNHKQKIFRSLCLFVLVLQNKIEANLFLEFGLKTDRLVENANLSII